MSAVPLRYEESAPESALTAYVRCYWSLRGAARTAEGATWRILPDGCADALFEPGSETIHWVGTMTRALEVRPGRSADVFGVRFEPGVTKTVRLIEIQGDRIVHGQGGLVNGPLDAPGARDNALERARARGYLGA